MGILSLLIGRMLGKIFPGKIVSSCLGIGYLPSWQNYWSAFLALFILNTVLILKYSRKYILDALPITSQHIAFIFMLVAVAMLIIQIIGIFVFHAEDPAANSNENIVIQMASGQILTVGLAMPAIVAIYSTIKQIYYELCARVVQSPDWLNDFVYLLFFLMIPYLFFCFVEFIKPWPITWIQLNYNNAISITIEGLLHTFYTITLLYLIAFMFCDLTIHDTIVFNRAIIHYLVLYLYWLSCYSYGVLVGLYSSIYYK